MKNTLFRASQRTFAVVALLIVSAFAALANDTPPGGGTPPLPKPDLTILEVQPVYYQFGQYKWRANDELWAKIANIGNGNAGSFGMRFQWAQGYANQQWFWFYPGGMAAGETHWVKISSQGYNLYVRGSNAQLMIDHNYAITESNETNNVYNR